MIRFDHYSLFFDNRPVLRDLSFAIAGPGLTAIVGASGCGKSTLLKVMNRLIEPRFQLADARNPGWSYTGGAWFDGQTLADWDGDALRRRIGHVLQKPLVFGRTLADNLVRVRRHLDGRVTREEAERLAWHCLGEAALADEIEGLDRPLGSLSGGQEQRLCIARALIAEPQVLCLDEPTSALDPFATAAVEATMRRMARKRPVIVVTHHIDQARACDRVLFLHNGDGDGARIIGDGTPREVFDVSKDSESFRFAHARSEIGGLTRSECAA